MKNSTGRRYTRRKLVTGHAHIEQRRCRLAILILALILGYTLVHGISYSTGFPYAGTKPVGEVARHA